MSSRAPDHKLSVRSGISPSRTYFRDRALRRGKAGDAAWGWTTAYGKPEAAQERTQERAREQQREGAK